MKKRDYLILLLLVVPLLLLSCDDTDKYLDSVDAAGWAMEDSQEVEGVTFKLYPCNSDFVPTNEFREGENVNFVLSIANNRKENLRILEDRYDDPEKEGTEEFMKYFMGIEDEEGKFVVSINGNTSPDWINWGMSRPYDLLSEETRPAQPYADLGDFRYDRRRNMDWFCWPAVDSDSFFEDHGWLDGVWTGLPCVRKGIYSGVVKTKLSIYERVTVDEASGVYDISEKPIVTANLDLSVKFIVRSR